MEAWNSLNRAGKRGLFLVVLSIFYLVSMVEKEEMLEKKRKYKEEKKARKGAKREL